jgi:hypothetical protein
MRRTPPIALAVLGLLTGALAASVALPATYHGRDLDGRRYQASVLNADFGQIDNAEVRFQGDHAYVYIHGRTRLLLILEDEEIVDPHRIPAEDPRHGITWEIDLKELAGR